MSNKKTVLFLWRIIGLVYGAVLAIGIIVGFNIDSRVAKFCFGCSLSGFGMLLGSIVDKE